MLLHRLTYLRDTYSFAHRDLKTNNIVIMPNTQVGLIDFGLSTITLNVGGVNYKIVNDMMYNYELECNPKQDLGVFLTQIYAHNNPRIRDAYVRMFFDIIFPRNQYGRNPLLNKIQEKATMRENKAFFHGAYNYNGSLYNCPVGNSVSLGRVREVLNYVYQLTLIPARGVFGGSQQRRRKTIRHKTHRRRKTIRRRK
jgi:serine/threonine protein kinase